MMRNGARGRKPRVECKSRDAGLRGPSARGTARLAAIARRSVQGLLLFPVLVTLSPPATCFAAAPPVEEARQDVAGSPAAQPAEPVSKAISAQEAPGPEEILVRAAERQGRTDTGTPEGMIAKLVVRKVDPQTGDDFRVRAERRFLRPYYIWQSLKEGDTETVSAFDGKKAWTQIGEEIHYLDGSDYRDDRKRLAEDIDQTVLISRLFFLANLAEDLHELERLDDCTWEDRTAYVLRGTTVVREKSERESEQTAKLTLWIDQENYELLGCRVEDLADQPPNQLHFEQWKKNKDDIAHPKYIHIYQNDEADWRIEIQFLQLDFSPELEEDHFRPPQG